MSLVLFVLLLRCARLEAYSNPLYTVAKERPSILVSKCVTMGGRRSDSPDYASYNEVMVQDPFDSLERDLHSFLYGRDEDSEDLGYINELREPVEESDFYQYIMGNAFRSELFLNKSGVHLVPEEFVHKGYCLLNITEDFMQTAVNAFAIFLYCTKKDVERLPARYVLESTRAISMLNVPREKLRATWKVIKSNNKTFEISYETLEKYRPLFKYVSGKEMAKLNLRDDRILRFIATHPDLNRYQTFNIVGSRHKANKYIVQGIPGLVIEREYVVFHVNDVGVVTGHYIHITRNWNHSTYLNKMNNLLCGVPITFMRRVPSNSYLQLPHETFYHIRACDRLQRQFYLTMMTKTLALGKSYSWNTQDVARLGLLLTEVDGTDLAAINPEAVAGISPQVMDLMPPKQLTCLTDLQLRYLNHKALNILTRKLKKYQDELMLSGCEGSKLYVVLVPCVLIKLYLINY